ncbi:MAG: IS1634 family transposase [Okeania sp. SIO3C4]|nr:IS1634 family transposase [Okeania sp. SIO3B3]NER02889.1 IS1634 family transposase [Okeania sp. SIO3C4]
MSSQKLSRITYGYSRDKRPDLKQFTMDLICTNDGDVPLWMRIGSGNESDQKEFVQAMKGFKNQLNFDSLMVADSALYTQENLQ